MVDKKHLKIAVGIKEVVVSFVLIAVTLQFFYGVGIWIGTSITLSAYTEKVHETSLRSSSNIRNDQQAATIGDHPVGIINSKGMSKFFLAWFFGSKNAYAVPEYRFPTVDERFEYYMGDWYNKTDWILPTCQGLVHLDDNATRDTFRASERRQPSLSSMADTIIPLETLESCKDINMYCSDAFDTLSKANKNSSMHLLAMFKFGDKNTELASYPVVGKARPVLKKNSYASIIWPLNTHRHYGQLEELWRNKIGTKTKTPPKEVEWKDKESKVFWRGTTTGDRVDLLKRWIHYDSNVIDIAFHKTGSSYRGKFLGNYLESHNKRQQASVDEMLKYRYLLSVEGNDVPTGLKWMLYSNSVVLMSPPTMSSWAMEDLLLPFVHYIPLADDYSNLFEMVQWAEEHQDACQVISKRATDFIDKLWLSEQARVDTEILRERLANAYVTQFQTQLATCELNDSNTLTLKQDKWLL